MHIQKTAGTSIQETARYVYGNEGVVSHGDFLRLGQDGCAPVPFVSGHFGFSFAEQLMDGRYSFTFLRDPIDRVISFYGFCASQATDEFPLYAAARRTDLEGFLRLDEETIRAHVWNNQVWQLAFGYGSTAKIGDFRPRELLRVAKRNLERFDYVGFVETFDQDSTEIFRDLGAEKTLPRRVNVSSFKPARNELRRSTMKLLLEYTELDRRLYSYAWRRRFGWLSNLRRRVGLNGQPPTARREGILA